jgi:hypothetical protein
MRERRMILKEWESSDLTRAEFCKKHGMSISSLRQWKKMISERSNEFEVPDFIEVAPAPTPENSSPSRKFFRITTSYGAVIEVPL